MVVQDRSVRHATAGPWNISDEDYLGVSFVEGPERVEYGESVKGVLGLDYALSLLFEHRDIIDHLPSGVNALACNGHRPAVP